MAPPDRDVGPDDEGSRDEVESESTTTSRKGERAKAHVPESVEESASEGLIRVAAGVLKIGRAVVQHFLGS